MTVNWYVTPKPAWVEHARVLLVEVAAKEEVIFYSALYDQLRMSYTELPERGRGRTFMNYLSPILAEMGSLNRLNEEPALSCLVRSKDRWTAQGYVTAVANRYGYRPEFPLGHAEVEAGKCYRFFGRPQ